MQREAEACRGIVPDVARTPSITGADARISALATQCGFASGCGLAGRCHHVLRANQTSWFVRVFRSVCESAAGNVYVLHSSAVTAITITTPPTPTHSPRIKLLSLHMQLMLYFPYK